MDELISRGQAIETFKDCAVNGVGIDGIVDALEQLPLIQPKRGRWVLVCDNNGMHFICNKCGAWRYHQEQKFCGECGADMREVNNESN